MSIHRIGAWGVLALMAGMAARARAEVENNWDMSAITSKLVDGYHAMVKAKRSAAEGR